MCVGQGWGPPQYRCSTSADLLGQAVHLYQVAVPRVSATWIPGSPNTDRHLALISCAQAGLHAIAVNSRVIYDLGPHPYPDFNSFHRRQASRITRLLRPLTTELRRPPPP